MFTWIPVFFSFLSPKQSDQDMLSLAFPLNFSHKHLTKKRTEKFMENSLLTKTNIHLLLKNFLEPLNTIFSNFHSVM